MSRGRSRRGLTIAGLIAVVMAIIIAGVVNAGNAAAAEGKVNRVVDGDTVDIVLHGKTERIRLLNVNAPESVDPNKSVECLGPEAAAFLKGTPPGRHGRHPRMTTNVMIDMVEHWRVSAPRMAHWSTQRSPAPAWACR